MGRMVLTLDPPTTAVQADPTAAVASRPKAEMPAETPSAAHYIGLGILIASIVIFLITTISLLAYRGDVLPALGVGAFVTFWFGPPFGLIFGGAVWSSHQPGMH